MHLVNVTTKNQKNYLFSICDVRDKGRKCRAVQRKAWRVVTLTHPHKHWCYVVSMCCQSSDCSRHVGDKSISLVTHLLEDSDWLLLFDQSGSGACVCLVVQVLWAVYIITTTVTTTIWIRTSGRLRFLSSHAAVFSVSEMNVDDLLLVLLFSFSNIFFLKYESKVWMLSLMDEGAFCIIVVTWSPSFS